jgi:hypothetical protein
VQVDGRAASFRIAAQQRFQFSAADRSRVERVDLLVGLPAGGGGGSGQFVDSDGDGVSDADEARAGTNAQDSNDYLRFTSITAAEGSGVRLLWTSIAGRRYTIQRSQTIGPDAVFTPVVQGVLAPPPLNQFLNTDAGAVTFTDWTVVSDVLLGTNEGVLTDTRTVLPTFRFYRIRLGP